MNPAPRIGVVGVGALGSRHAASLAELATRGVCALSGVHDLRPERARTAAVSLRAPAHDSLDALCAASDGVVVAVPTVAHETVGRACLERGVGVLVEKPIADSLAAADALLEAARRAGRPLFVGHSERFNRALRAAAPHLGAPRYLEAERLAEFTPRATDVDVVLDLMIHDLDLALALAGTAPVQVSAIGVAVLTDTEDLANAWLEFPDGAVASLTASRVSPERVRKVRLFAEHRYVSMDFANRTAEAALVDPKALAQAARAFAAHAAHAAGAATAPPLTLPDPGTLIGRRTLEAPEGLPLTLELEAFARALAGEPASGPGLGLATGADGRAALAVALEVRRAMRERAARWTSRASSPSSPTAPAPARSA
jgi:predicted dehydrogenase